MTLHAFAAAQPTTGRPAVGRPAATVGRATRARVASGAQNAPSDSVALGRRVRHLRRAAGLTLDDLAERTGMSPSALSLIENGRREPKISALTAIAQALGVTVAHLLTAPPPNRRATLEVELEHIQRTESFAALGIPAIRIGPRLPTEALEALVGLHHALADVHAERVATPEHARRANAELRETMRARDNYFGDIERAAADLLRATGHDAGPITRSVVDRMAAHLGFTLAHRADLPSSARSVTDLKHRRIYLPQPEAGQHDSRALALQALGSVVLGHGTPADYAEFLAQRVAINYFAAALLIPEHSAVAMLRDAKARKDIAIEDLRDAYAVSYETAAHRFTNLATHHLGIPVHFMRISAAGIVYKAYANDGVRFPADATGAIEGGRVCRYWTARQVFEQPDLSAAYQQYTDTSTGTYWCTSVVDPTPDGLFSVSVGVRYADVKWMRGRDTTQRSVSRCPDPSCCASPPRELAERWAGLAWPSARAHSHLLAAMPPGVFPGVDLTEVLRFLERQPE